MKRNNYVLLFFFFSTAMLFSQTQEKLLQIKVMADGNYVGGINVVNLVNERSAVTDEKGEFFILAKEDDLLVFSAINFEYKRKIISSEDLVAPFLTVNMVPKTNQLDEVVITEYPNINAVDLGILSKPAKVYTPAERKLKTATDLNLMVGFGFAMSLDPVINAISGRTKSLKDQLKVERREYLLKEVQNLYEEEYFINTLKIPQENVKAFQYYSIEDVGFVETLKAKKKQMADFLLVQLSKKYLQLLSDEN
ncbi:peptidase associated/transthyretin-like domain-containing protein [Flavobacterium microcysteis]|uniref:Carboxypeptidase-like regulatory domain-containing protein n=1 Tax=Flavobacterium microcysteis TaxID=2596891 RepID=A0A501Q0Y2_9FLAO|nr:carboxypeptidase-like regulatory domain-containing protein [Flavobacterium microcysteis]TPD65611.1 carboxypeptidase-like regulatory domain-containing protein [Flavobacterium microcysteis]